MSSETGNFTLKRSVSKMSWRISWGVGQSTSENNQDGGVRRKLSRELERGR